MSDKRAVPLPLGHEFEPHPSGVNCCIFRVESAEERFCHQSRQAHASADAPAEPTPKCECGAHTKCNEPADSACRTHGAGCPAQPHNAAPDQEDRLASVLDGLYRKHGFGIAEMASIHAALEAVVAEEREACAKLALVAYGAGAHTPAQYVIAGAIRARGLK